MRRNTMNKEYAFLFGAGAEAKFGLPLGPSFTYETMLHKKDAMLDALNAFYSCNADLSYIREFMFQKNSRTLLLEYINSLKRNSALLNKIPDLEKAVQTIEINPDDKESNEIIKSSLNGIYDTIISDVNSLSSPYKDIINDLAYFGAIEKDFSTIIDPNRVGRNRFWRLINYFWSAFFTILLPLLDNSAYYIKNEQYQLDKYKYVLDNLEHVLNSIEQKFFYDNSKYSLIDKGINYYQVLSEAFDPQYVLTTNYTPIVRQFFSNAKFAYLSGELTMFEDINTMSVRHYSASSRETALFPFLLTQAPIKPIICPYQIRQYTNLDKCLNEISILFVLGYSFCEYDSHINSFIRDFIEKKDNHLICYTYKSDKDKDLKNFIKSKTEETIKALRLSSITNITIIPIPDTPEELRKCINDFLH